MPRFRNARSRPARSRAIGDDGNLNRFSPPVNELSQLRFNQRAAPVTVIPPNMAARAQHLLAERAALVTGMPPIMASRAQRSVSERAAPVTGIPPIMATRAQHSVAERQRAAPVTGMAPIMAARAQHPFAERSTLVTGIPPAARAQYSVAEGDAPVTGLPQITEARAQNSVVVVPETVPGRRGIMTVGTPVMEMGDNGGVGNFLDKCHYCEKRIGINAEVYMYKSLHAFCSPECRFKEMIKDEVVKKLTNPAKT